MDTLTFPLEIKEDGFGEDDDYFTFAGYASTFGNEDRGGDVVVRGAFGRCLAGMRNNGRKIKVLWQHDMSQPLGVFTEMKEDDRGLYVEGRMPKSDAFVRDRVMPQMRAGSISDMSIGYVVRDYETNGNVRELKEIDLYEVSLVTVPMNPLAMVTGFKRVVSHGTLLPLGPRDREWDSAAALRRVREWAGADDEPNERYRRAFLYYDPENEDEFGGYKLPIADVINGRLTAIPRGIFAAAGAISGARGGVDIPDADRAPIRRTLDRYYDAMGLDSPFEERRCFRVDDLSAYTPRELEKLMKSGIVLAGEKAREVVSAVKSLKRDADEVKRDADISPEVTKALNGVLSLLNSQQSGN